jgi:DNA polymerase V
MAFPSPAEGAMEERIDLNRLLVKRPAATFFVRYEGGEEPETGLRPGDVLIVDRSLIPGDGDAVVARLDDEHLVGVLRRREGRWRLLTGDGAEIEIDPERDFAVWGKIANFIRFFPPARIAELASSPSEEPELSRL